MKMKINVTAFVVFSLLASYSFFIIPAADAGYYGYSNMGDDDYTGDRYSKCYMGDYDQNNYNDPYYLDAYLDNYYFEEWPDEADWLNETSWYDRDRWQYQDRWFKDRYLSLNYQQNRQNYRQPDEYSAVWHGKYKDGAREVIWNSSNHPIFLMKNYDASRYDRYSSQYGYGKTVNLNPSYARAIAIVDSSKKTMRLS